MVHNIPTVVLPTCTVKIEGERLEQRGNGLPGVDLGTPGSAFGSEVSAELARRSNDTINTRPESAFSSVPGSLSGAPERGVFELE